MADIRNFPAVDPAAPQVPELSSNELERLQTENQDLRVENQRLRAYLNNLEKLTQRVLALRANRGRLLWLAIGAAILLYASIPGTLGNRALVAGWQKFFPPPPQVHAHFRPALRDIPPESSTVAPSPATVPPATPSLSEPAASPLPLSKPLPSPTPIPSPLPTCNGNHLPTDPICPPMGHRPKPSSAAVAISSPPSPSPADAAGPHSSSA